MNEVKKKNRVNPGKSDDFLEIFSKGKDFLEELITENERLRQQVIKLRNHQDLFALEETEIEIPTIESKIKNFEEKIRKLENEKMVLEQENSEFANRLIEVEEQNNNLANLYVASHQLHSTLDFKEIVQIVMEIIINLIGAEQIALYLLEKSEKTLLLASSEPDDLKLKDSIPIGSGVIGIAAEKGESYYMSEINGGGTSLDPLAVIPLTINENIIGVIAIYKLFIQKNGFSSTDHELFSLLAGHAATAIFSAQLYAQSERKLSTLRRFLELLKSE